MSARVELYRERPSQEIKRGYGFSKSPPYRWRFVSSNGRILADSGQGYVRRIDALTGCAAVLGAHHNLDVDEFQRYVWDYSKQLATAPDWQRIPVRDLTKAKP